MKHVNLQLASKRVLPSHCPVWMKAIATLLFVALFNAFWLNAYAQTRNITGNVTSSDDNSALPGVNVIIKGTSTGTVTDLEGSYTLEIPGGSVVLVFSSVGYVSEEVNITNETVMDMVMSADVTALDEIVVVGYGTERKGDVTGAISSVTSKDIHELPVVYIGNALQGRAAGVVSLASGSRPGDGVTIRIRGRRSLTADNIHCLL